MGAIPPAATEAGHCSGSSLCMSQNNLCAISLSQVSRLNLQECFNQESYVQFNDFIIIDVVNGSECKWLPQEDSL